jgi:hypothetical protein
VLQVEYIQGVQKNIKDIKYTEYIESTRFVEQFRRLAVLGVRGSLSLADHWCNYNICEKDLPKLVVF